ncbi:post-PEP-CTERM-1 domain-containing protein [uncultured Massilia sp.]|uniref:post-PEP-CTERM-1 domain-containing protein n=1 Tax=uncultured Massilia sp. TaxID=169973 RepID=UPI0025F3B66F|nr:hypothetical protein [uncultured Massilia sp.]
MSKPMMLRAGALAALCLLATCALQARAAGLQDGQVGGDDPGQDRGQEGMVVVRDPQTGKLRAPTAEEARALRAKTPRDAAIGAARAPQVVAGRAGARGVRLGEKSMVYDVVTRDADGKLSSQCVHGAQAAQDALHRPSPDAKEHDHATR